MAVKLFMVTGTFIIPGTREKAKFSGKVIAESRHHGSKQMANHLQEEFGWAGDDHADRGKRAPRGVKFSPDFALLHLQWSEVPKAVTPTAAPIESTQTI